MVLYKPIAEVTEAEFDNMFAIAEDITTCLKAGIVHHVIAMRFGLEEIAEAHEMQENGKAIGNLVLIISQ
jgi:NADPH:quinone reductase-like Zn-dependent oxidoreductase